MGEADIRATITMIIISCSGVRAAEKSNGVISNMTTNDELQRAFSIAENLASDCLDCLHDAMFDLKRERVLELIEMAEKKLGELTQLTTKYPAISFDLNEVRQIQRHIKWLREENQLVALLKIEKELGKAEMANLRAESFRRNDHLGRAAQFSALAAEHEVAGQLDEFWNCIEHLKQEYLLYAQKSGFTRKQTLALVTSPFKQTADVLRKEARHQEALRHYMYFLAHSGRKSATNVKRLTAFLNRGGIAKERHQEAIECVRASCDHDGFDLIDFFLQS